MTKHQAEMRPTGELRQHHELMTPTRGLPGDDTWKVKTRLTALREASRIDDADIASADRFMLDWNAGVEGIGSRWLREKVDGGGGGMSHTDHRMAALERLRFLTAAIGQFNVDMLDRIVIRDMSWTKLGMELGKSAKTAQSWAVQSIQALTAFYVENDKTRRL